MLNFPGYLVLNQISESTNSLVYRGICTEDGQPVILKLLKSDYPTPAEIARFKREYEITRSLQGEGIIQAYRLATYQQTLAIVFEDFGGQSLKSRMQERNFTLLEFLNLAIRLTEILAEIHAANIIHKDLNPSNIVLNSTTHQLKIIDFGIATTFTHKNLTIQNPLILEGTLAYLSPEQTGRMNRCLDYRSDFYSLGVTFYEMLTGQLPFMTPDAMELVHCHLAKAPKPVCTVNPAIPEPLSHIVMKLLAKNAEDRYQTTWGLKADLNYCLTQLQTSTTISRFTLGLQDISDRFQIPQKLYGRDREIKMLMATLLRLISDRKTANSTLLLVTGYAGIGKSTLVQEIRKIITEKRGYFTVGKFEQLQLNTPYSGIVNAFQGLVQQLLVESEAKLQQWREKFLTALGQQSQIIIDVIPDLALIIGQQPAIPDLEGTESQNRFNLVFQKFIRVFCQQEVPLTIFLDDLQWVDPDSLHFIQLMMTDLEGEENRQSLLIVGAYRENEVRSTHPLALTIEQLQKTGKNIQTIALKPLSVTSICQWIADILHCNLNSAKPLAELVFKKTGGNPFFINEFLKQLNNENLITFNPQCFSWQWDINKIKNKDFANNVIDLTIDKLKTLPKATQQVLFLAACIGTNFDLNILSLSCGRSPAAVASNLMPALKAGLIVATSGLNADLLVEEYQFLHDRVQQAAYTLIDERERQAIHLKIGRLLWQCQSSELTSETLFTIADHLNLGAHLVKDTTEWHEIANLNLLAGQKAKAAVAYGAAFKYLTAGIELLATDSWQTQYSLTLALYQEAIEVAYLCKEFQQMENLAQVALQQVHRTLDKVKIYEVQLPAYTTQGKPLQAVKLGRQALEELGVPLTELPTLLEVQRTLVKTKLTLKEKNIEELIHLPLMTDAYQLARMKILSAMSSPTYQAAPILFPWVICEQINLSIQQGNSQLASSVYAAYAALLVGFFQDLDSAYQFGQLALTLVQSLKAEAWKTKTLFLVGACAIHGKLHIKETLPLFERAYQSGLENGNLEYGSYALAQKCHYSYFLGVELSDLEREMTMVSHVLAQMGQDNACHWHETFYKTVLSLRGEAGNPSLLAKKIDEEENLLAQQLAANDRTGLHYFYLNKLILSYLFGNYEEALEYAIKAEHYLDGVMGFLTVPLFYFYDSLARLAVFASLPSLEQESMLAKAIENQKKMQRWAEQAPINFQHQYDLVEAEKSRILGQMIEAMEFYDSAIKLAKAYEYLPDEALANQLAAQFYANWGKHKIAKVYMTDARYCYERWGAVAKVHDLEKRYLPLLTRLKIPNHLLTTNTTATQISTSGNFGATLDFASAIKASQAIAREMVLEDLLTELMKILIQNAGAEFGYLILQSQDRLLIEASGKSESESILVLQSLPIDNRLPHSIINYVVRTKKELVFVDAYQEIRHPKSQFYHLQDSYFDEHQPKSILCVPLLNQGQLLGIIYLENSLIIGAFTSERLELVKLLSAQAAIAITNAKLYTEVCQSEGKLTQFLEALPVGVSVHTLSGEVSYINQTGQRLLGQQHQLSVYRDFLASIDYIYRAQTNRAYPKEELPLLRSLKGETVIADDLEVHLGEKVIPLEVHSQPIFNGQGQIVASINVFQDITSRKQAEALLAEYNRTLEAQVQARTYELSETLENLKATQQELIQSEKMAALGQLIAGVAHEINTPLGAIRSSIQNIADFFQNNLLQLPDFFQNLSPDRCADFFALLQRSAQQITSFSSKEKRQFKKALIRQLTTYEIANADLIADMLVDIGIYDGIEPFLPLLHDPDSINILRRIYRLGTLQRSTRTILTATDRAAKIVFALKNYARYNTSEEKEIANIIDGIETVLTLYQNQFKQGVEVIRNYAENLPTIRCYPDELNQVWTNLIHNSLQAIENRGTIQIEVTEQKGTLLVTITDSGKGIPPEIIGRIFEPFFTTKPPGQGSGLGLDIVKKILEKHQGKIEVTSKPGQTSFTVSIPVLSEGAP